MNYSFNKSVTIITLIFCALTTSLIAQVGINTTSPGNGAILDISSSTQGMLVPRIDIPDLDEISPITGGSTQSLLVYNIGTTTTPGFYYWNVGSTEWIPLTTEEDDDFYEVGTTTTAKNITDDIYRTGKMGIGKSTADYPLDIEDTANSRALNVDLSGSTDASTHAIYARNQNTSDNVHYGVYSLVQNNTGTGNRYGMYNNVQIPGSQTNQAYGIYNNLTAGSGGNGAQTGTFNRLGGDVYRGKTGVTNYITGTDNAQHIGVSTNLSGTGTGNHTGVQNIIRGEGNLKGVYNTFSSASGDNENTGTETQNTNDGNGTHKGFHTRLDGDGTGNKIGNENYITGQGGAHIGSNNVLKRDGSQSGTTGTGDKTGTRNNITDSEGDNYGVNNLITGTVTGKTSYGTYSDVSSSNGTNIGGYFTAHGTGGTYYAAIFDQGNVGVGTSAPSTKLEVVGKVKATTLNLTGLPVYANNSAASSLAVGDVYRTSSGVLMVRY